MLTAKNESIPLGEPVVVDKTLLPEITMVIHDGSLDFLYKQAQRKMYNSARWRTAKFNPQCSAAASLMHVLEEKDMPTAYHCWQVACLALVIGKKLAMADADLECLWYAALLHDIGKMKVNQSVLNKPSELTSEEYCRVMAHVRLSVEMVEPFFSDKIVDMIRYHHYYYNGQGYANDRFGEQIPLGARIIAVADAYDAMTSDRPYRRHLSHEQAIFEICSCGGTQFDLKVILAFLNVVDEYQALHMHL